MRILVNMVNTLGVEGRGTPFDAMHLVAFGQQELRQIRTILTGDTGNQCFFYFFSPLFNNSQNRNACGNCCVLELCILGRNGQAVAHRQFRVSGVVAPDFGSHHYFEYLTLPRARACIDIGRVCERIRWACCGGHGAATARLLQFLT